MSQMDALPVWLAPLYERFAADVARGRVAHALMLAGPAGFGKGLLASRMVGRLLCRHPDEQGIPCMQCQDCRNLQAGAHPDYHLLAPEEPGKPIRIGPVRALCADLALTTRGGRRVAVIRHAEVMTIEAANALLKTLEEPPPETVILLLANQPTALPATVRSRVQRLDMPQAPTGAALDWLGKRTGREREDLRIRLAACEGAPWQVLDELETEGGFDREGFVKAMLDVLRDRADPLLEAGRWSKAPSQSVAAWAYRLVRDLLRVRMGLAPAVLIDRGPELGQIVGDMTEQALVAYHEQLVTLSAQARHPLNRELVMEQFFMGLKMLNSTP